MEEVEYQSIMTFKQENFELNWWPSNILESITIIAVSQWKIITIKRKY